MGHEAGEKLLSEIHHGGCVDSHTQDQVYNLPVELPRLEMSHIARKIVFGVSD